VSISLSLCEKVTIANSWQGGFQALTNIESNTDLHGWKVTLVFGEPVDQLEVTYSKYD